MVASWTPVTASNEETGYWSLQGHHTGVTGAVDSGHILELNSGARYDIGIEMSFNHKHLHCLKQDESI